MLQHKGIDVVNLNSRLYWRRQRASLFQSRTDFTFWHCHTHKDYDTQAQVWHWSSRLTCLQGIWPQLLAVEEDKVYSYQILTTSSGLFTSYFWIDVPFRNSNCDSLSFHCVSPLPINIISSPLLLLKGCLLSSLLTFPLYLLMAADWPFFSADLCFLNWDDPTNPYGCFGILMTW